MPAQEDRYQELMAHLKQMSVISSCMNLLNWDRETYMPPAGGQFRSEQLSWLAGELHQLATAPLLGEILEELKEAGFDPMSPEAANIREVARDYRLAVKLPQDFVKELSRVRTLSQQNWAQAKQASDFSSFQPWLEQIISLKQQEADYLKSDEQSRYDALLDQYEPGMKTEQVKSLFGPLREELVDLVAAIRESGVSLPTEILERNYPVEQQQAFAEQMAEKIGFDFHAGRVDVSAHPFCDHVGPGDCRLTTRFDPQFFSMAFFGTMHEAGHGIYEQSLNQDQFGIPLGSAISLGIHESQSRLWENLVGRSRSFWKYAYPRAQEQFSESLSSVELEDFYRAINSVQPSFIRVEADEVTYNLHIMLRFELEQELISGEISVADLPEIWNERFQTYFGIIPSHDAEGCLQDVHWSAGLIGYFPTYALGNMFAAQFFAQAEEDLSDLSNQIERGEFQPLKEWLSDNIHQHGRQFSANETVERITGQSLDSKILVSQLKQKFGDIYQLN